MSMTAIPNFGKAADNPISTQVHLLAPEILAVLHGPEQVEYAWSCTVNILTTLRNFQPRQEVQLQVHDNWGNFLFWQKTPWYGQKLKNKRVDLNFRLFCPLRIATLTCTQNTTFL